MSQTPPRPAPSTPQSPPSAASASKVKESRQATAIERRNGDRVKSYIVQSLWIACDETLGGDRAERVRRDREGSPAMLQLAASDFRRRQHLKAVRAREREAAEIADRRRGELSGSPQSQPPITSQDLVRRKRLNADLEQERQLTEARREFSHQKYLKALETIRLKKERHAAKFYEATRNEEKDRSQEVVTDGRPEKVQDLSVVLHKKWLEEAREARENRIKELNARRQPACTLMHLRELEEVLRDSGGQPDRLREIANDFEMAFDVLELETSRNSFF
jgi:hypothetical protein